MSVEKNEIESTEEERFGIKIHTGYVKSESAAQKIFREIGTYITLTLPCKIHYLSEIYSAGECLASALKDLFAPYYGKRLCICGIGNSQLTEDSLGPNAVRKLSLEAFSFIPSKYCHFQEVFGAIPEVSYYTNFPTERTVSGITKEMEADCILLIDSLVTHDYENLYQTIQLSTGSGLAHFHNRTSPDWKMDNHPACYFLR